MINPLIGRFIINNKNTQPIVIFIGIINSPDITLFERNSMMIKIIDHESITFILLKLGFCKDQGIKFTDKKS